jgi:hypothetical protein
MISEQEMVDSWQPKLSRFLGLPDKENRTVELGTFIFADLPSLAYEFINAQIMRDKDSPFLSFSGFQSFFNEKNKPPRELTKSEIASLADQKHFRAERHKELWKQWRAGKESQDFDRRLKLYEESQRQELEFKREFQNNEIGYIEYLEKYHIAIRGFVRKPITIWLEKGDITPHSYITGATRSGKSYLLELLAYHIIKDKNSSLVVIDPHGDLAESIARLKINHLSDRLIYFYPYLAKGKNLYPVMNPLSTNDSSLIEADLSTQELMKALRIILNAKGGEFTPQMENILKKCLKTLYLKKDSTIYDLYRFMNNDFNKCLLESAKSNNDYMTRSFFNNEFDKKEYRPSKHGNCAKIDSMFLSDNAICKTIVGDQTFDLEEAFNSNKIILVNLSGGTIGEDAGEIIGKFFVARLMGYARARAEYHEDKRSISYLFIDECQTYITETIKKILTEAGKYNLNLTLAQQIPSGDMNVDIYNAVISNTKFKATGKNIKKVYTKLERDIGTPLSELENNRRHVFSIQREYKPTLPIQISPMLTDSTIKMSEQEWEDTKADQIKRYYRPPMVFSDSPEVGSKQAKGDETKKQGQASEPALEAADFDY